MSNRSALLPHLLSVLAFTAVAVAWAVFILAKGGGLPDLGEKAYEVSAVIPSGAALAPGSRVTMAGVQVGKVKSVKREGMGAQVVLEVDDDEVLPLASDTRIQVRQHTPVGENYVSLAAGKSARKLESGDALPITQADEFVDVDRLLSVLKGGTRERARQTIQSLGGALEGREGKLNDLLGGASDFLKPAEKFVDVLYADRRQASRLVQQLGDVTAAIGQRDQAITTIARDGLAGMQALASRDDALRETLEQLPSSLQQIRSTSQTVNRVSGVAGPVVTDASAALRALQPAIRRLPQASTDGRGVLRELSGAAPVLETTLKRVTTLAPPLAAALPKVRKTICEAAPVLRYAKPYMPEMLGILIGLGSASNSYDATGNLIRLAPIVGENSASGLPDGIQDASNALLYGGLLGELGPTINFDPYPKVGSLGKTVATSNVPSGPEKVDETGFKYPRVEADC